MKTVFIHEFAKTVYENRARTERTIRSIRVVYSIIRYGSKAASKVNPLTLAIDAIISVLDAFRSYIAYRKAREVTKQLEYELKAAEETFIAKKAEFEELFQTEKLKIDLHIEEIRQKILKDEEKMKLLQKIYDESGEHLKIISKILKEHKRTYLGDERLRELEQKYIEAVHARMTITITIIGG